MHSCIHGTQNAFRGEHIPSIAVIYDMCFDRYSANFNTRKEQHNDLSLVYDVSIYKARDVSPSLMTHRNLWTTNQLQQYLVPKFTLSEDESDKQSRFNHKISHS